VAALDFGEDEPAGHADVTGELAGRLTVPSRRVARASTARRYARFGTAFDVRRILN
jgi:hypothetical protein